MLKGQMPKKKRVRFRSRSAKKTRKDRKRPYTRSKHAHAKRRHAKRHRSRAVVEEAKMANYLLNQQLKTVRSTESDPYNYHPRHPTKDPEYKFSSKRVQAFKDEFPAPDVHFWRAQGENRPPYVGNFGAARYKQPWRELIPNERNPLT